MREFRIKNKNKKQQVWKIWIDPKDPETYITSWGILDGKFQETKDRPGDCGVKGHADYQTPEQYAQFCMSREIRKKMESGYIEYIDGKPVSENSNTIDFNKPLPKQLTFYKPQKELTDRKLSALNKINKLIWTVKRDGMMHIAVKSNKWEIYTRRMDLTTDKFPHIIDSLNKLNIPNNSILLGEMVFIDQKDDFKKTSKICRSDIDLALAYQGLGEFPKNIKDKVVLGKLKYYIFDIAYLDNKDLVSNNTTGERLELLNNLFGIKLDLSKDYEIKNKLLNDSHISPLQLVDISGKYDLDIAKENNFEGFVVLDINARYKENAYSFDGKARRPDGIWKRKPKFEEEFIIDECYEGSGRNMGRLGGFLISQYHPTTNKRINCGKCGGGFTDEQRIKFLREAKKITGSTVKIEFDSRQTERNGVYALRFPVFKGFCDKIPEECIAQFIKE